MCYKACVVSIHAPREGCDRGLFASPAWRISFQFTHPGRGATASPLSLSWVIMFQFTHPGRGATVDSIVAVDKPEVSIHAPREGCDLLAY